MRAMGSLSLLYIGIFRILQGKLYAPYLWYELKVNNNLLLTALTGSLIMFQYPLCLLMLYSMIILRFASCVVPI